MPKKVIHHPKLKVEETTEQIPPEEIKSVVGDTTIEPIKEVEGVQSETSAEKEVPSEKKNKKLYVLGALAVIIILVLSGLVVYLTIRLNNSYIEQKKASVEEITPEVSDAVKPLTKGEITLEIFNGSGVSGKAKEVAVVFTDLGYQVVKTGNAPLTEGNSLLVGKDIMDRLEVLLTDTKEELNISSVSGELTDSTASARIILGK